MSRKQFKKKFSNSFMSWNIVKQRNITTSFATTENVKQVLIDKVNIMCNAHKDNTLGYS